jgi:tetratricopeptide (TPR) repeat protein
MAWTRAVTRIALLRNLAAALVLTLLLAGCSSSEGTRPADAGLASSATVSPLLAETNDLVSFWEARVEKDAYDFTAYNKLADAYLRRARQTGDVSDYGRAQTALEQSLDVLPAGNLDAQLQLAFVKITQHDFRGGMALAQDALQDLPGDAYSLGIVGDAQLSLGQFAAADPTYLVMAKAAPGLSSFTRLASVYELRGDLTQAELSYKNAVDIDAGARPENTSWALVQLGNFYETIGKPDDAEDAYQRALQAYPGYVAALAGLANVDATRGKFDDAIALYKDVTARYPNPTYVIALGDIYTAAGKPEEASKQYGLVGVIDQLYRANGINTDLQMAMFFADHDRNLAESLQQARAAAQDRPSVQSADALAWALYKTGDYEDARAQAEQALSLGTRQPLYFFHAGMIAAKQGDTRAARDYLGRALAINPHFHVVYATEAKQTLDQLGGAL